MGCEEALRVPTEPRYDVVLADSVFQYFNDADYGQKVLERMWAKAGEDGCCHRSARSGEKDEHMAYRRKCVENYDGSICGAGQNILHQGDVPAICRGARGQM